MLEIAFSDLGFVIIFFLQCNAVNSSFYFFVLFMGLTERWIE